MQGIDVACNRGAAAVRDQTSTRLGRPTNQGTNLIISCRISHTVGKYPYIATAHGQPVRHALTAGMVKTVIGIR